MGTPARTAFLRSAAAALLLLFVSAAPGTASRAFSRAAPTLQATTITMPNGRRHTLFVAAGLRIALYASGLPTARFMALGPRGDIFVGSSDAGALWVLLHRRGGPRADRVVTLLSGLDVPHSVVYHNGLLYLGEQSRVSVMRYDPDHVRVYDRRVIIPNLPTGGHVTRTVGIGPDGQLYLSIGSSCNVCIEADPRRAALMVYHPNGTGGRLYARGLRNAVGITWQPRTGLLWATVNNRDQLGDNMPPELVTIVRRGDNFGWPYCWGDRHVDRTVPGATSSYCAHTARPTLTIQAHSAPLGLAFYTGALLPTRYRGGLFVAYHGSWNRSVPTGYKLVYIPVHGTRAGPMQDVVIGWLPAGATNGPDEAWGRPTGLLVAPDGSLLISDDKAGVVYRLAPAG
jgi:glucose/arabinose dehydrogenase